MPQPAAKKPKTKKGKSKTKLVKKLKKSAREESLRTAQTSEKSSGRKKPKKGSKRSNRGRNTKSKKAQSNREPLKIHAIASPQQVVFDSKSHKKKQCVEFWFTNQSLDQKRIYWSAKSEMKEIRVSPDIGLLKEDKREDIVITYKPSSKHQKTTEEEKSARIVITYAEAPEDAENFDEDDFNAKSSKTRKETISITIVANGENKDKSAKETDQDELDEESDNESKVFLEPQAICFRSPYRNVKNDKFFLNNKSRRPMMWHIKSTNNAIMKFDPNHGVLSAACNQTIAVHLLPFYQPEDAEDRFNRVTVEFIYLTERKGKRHTGYLHETMRTSPASYRRFTHIIVMGTLYQTAREELA